MVALPHEIFRGDNHIFTAQIVDQDALPVNIADWNIVFSMSKTRGQSVPTFQLYAEIVDEAAGQIKVELTPTETAETGMFLYDLQATTQATRVFTLDSGYLKIIQDVTP